ncbi:hypothetical protein BLNAU_21175 [Blattamonas nauphoetae]|uniref:Uncharacterized protein n=1 Tax=Blattamonas nauphoetae TaxID=2049346 RepID=A0ABQ9WWR3_9EUKA|nr:hypothetical protein BLNAU_21175 [Blattamonas nauphoetae]
MATLTLSLASWQAQFHSGELQESTAVRDCRKSQKFPFYLKNQKAGAMDISLPLTMSIHCAAARSQQIEINSIRKFKSAIAPRLISTALVGGALTSEESFSRMVRMRMMELPLDLIEFHPVTLEIEREKADEEEQIGLDEEERKHQEVEDRFAEDPICVDITVSGTTSTNAKTAKVLRSLLEVDKDPVEGSFDFTIENKSLISVTNQDILPFTKCGMFDLKDDVDSLKLDGVCLICSDSESSRHPLIKSTNHVTIQNCHFYTTDTSIEHAIFGVPLVSFNSFSVSGHALLAITTEQPTSFVSVNFEDITQIIAGKARCVHVTSSSLGTVVTPSHWAGLFTQSQRLLDFVESVISSSLDFDSIFGEEVFISKDSNDISVCSFSEYPCASLDGLNTSIGDKSHETHNCLFTIILNTSVLRVSSQIVT